MIQQRYSADYRILQDGGKYPLGAPAGSFDFPQTYSDKDTYKYYSEK